MNNLAKKLASYSTVAGALLTTSTSYSQVYDTELDPFVIIDNSSFDLDLNNDNLTDFTISNIQYHNTGTEKLVDTIYFNPDSNFTYGWVSYLRTEYWRADINALGSNGFRVIGTSNPSTLSSGYHISSVHSFVSGIGILGIASTTGWWGFSTWPSDPYTGIQQNTYSGIDTLISNGNFANKTTYAGLKFKDSNNDYHYGWVKLVVNGFGTTIIEEYAYEDSVGVCIEAGAKSTVGIIDYSDQNANIYSYGNEIIIHVNNSNLSPLDAKIYDITGSLVKEKKLTGTKTKIEMQGFKGIYIVKLGLKSKKVTLL